MPKKITIKRSGPESKFRTTIKVTKNGNKATIKKTTVPKVKPKPTPRVKPKNGKIKVKRKDLTKTKSKKTKT